MAPKTAGELHREWLELVDTDGPFLAVPPLTRAWPQGMPAPDPEALAALRDAKPALEKAWEHWDLHRNDQAALEFYRGARDDWVQTVLCEVLGWAEYYGEPSAGHAVHSPDRAVTVAPTGALALDDTTGALVLVVDPVDSLRDPSDDGWAASPIDRCDELLRASGVPIGVVTDGRWWAIVSAREQTMVASGIVDAQTWIEEPHARNAFLELLAPARLLGQENRLTELFDQSVAAAEDITEALGTQVRRAVELLVQAMSEASLDARRRGAPDPLPEHRGEVYEAAVTVMMRVVFLLFAEERGLLPQGELFAGGYGLSGELDALDARRREEGAVALDRTFLVWHRLLATTQALYRGASFEDVRIPSYGGSLFDPARYAFLTARTEVGTLAVPVSDRVMLEVLHAVQVAQLKDQPARRITFRDIDVEQIGYIYEKLLGYSSTEVTEVTIGLKGTPGEEPEIPLATLETLAQQHPGEAALADALRAWAKEHQPAAKPPSKSKLATGLRAETDDADQALREAASGPGLRERLRPFLGIIRRDLRDRPLVAHRGGILVVETPSRATAGAHYTPRSLAEEVVHYALEPLVYDPGPHQEPDPQRWKPLPSYRITELKIADIACGSGAFLVAAARYLAARLDEAWRREAVAVGTPQEQSLHAIRTVIANCIYGADINAMAVEMCKLSLWLVSLDPRLPFSFVDDKILHGNSLLGVTDPRQLKRQHIDPDAADEHPTLFEIDVDDVLRKASRLRTQLATEVDDSDPQRSTATKRRLLAEQQHVTAQLADIADGVIAAGLRLGGKPGKQLRTAYQNLNIAIGQAYPSNGGDGDRTMLDGILEAGLTPTVPTDYDRWKPLHWILAVPDVMDRGGFDAVIGNPPYFGGTKISGAQGTDMRDWVSHVLSNRRAGGRTDLIAYFFLRATSLLRKNGNLGLVATNSIAQGDTREVGLDGIVADGFTIVRSIQSKPWPAANAKLEYAAVWGTLGCVAAGVERVADDAVVRRITTLLEPAGRVGGHAANLLENVGVAFEGCKPYGAGFVLEPREASSWIEVDPANKDVLFPYLSGEDLNSRANASPSRWIIDFYDRSENEAKRYKIPFEHLVKGVRPERQQANRKSVRERWWQHVDKRPGMRRAIAGLDELLTIAITSKFVMTLRVKNDKVFSNTVAVFAADSFADQAVLSSSLHQTWAITYGSTLETRVRYTPSDVFETFPRPDPTERLAEAGRTLDTERREIMLRRQLGLTKLYNLVNDPDISDSADADVKRMREIHVELDHVVMEAYGWQDVPLEHGFHTYRQMQRWTVSPAARVGILDRLLAENHRRAALQGDAPPPADDTTDEGEDE